ncbi:hypothetical protein BaRGS_00028950 [Batillaria attramentaria]|uniref:Uncharacterized protein n=1 Tax=Batillaria attramentaria TaxID=370345 RepID=A0ABD0JYV4_9CAEN
MNLPALRAEEATFCESYTVNVKPKGFGPNVVRVRRGPNRARTAGVISADGTASASAGAVSFSRARAPRSFYIARFRRSHEHEPASVRACFT